jgi:hypothetical protein
MRFNTSGRYARACVCIYIYIYFLYFARERERDIYTSVRSCSVCAGMLTNYEEIGRRKRAFANGFLKSI